MEWSEKIRVCVFAMIYHKMGEHERSTREPQHGGEIDWIGFLNVCIWGSWVCWTRKLFLLAKKNPKGANRAEMLVYWAIN